MSKNQLFLFGVLFLWLAPISFAFFKHYGLKKDVDYTEYWKAHNAQVAWDMKVSQIREEVRRSKYSRGSSSSSESGESEPEVVYVDRPVIQKEVIREASYQSNQPDLSGFYWQRNYGTIQYVLGPF